MARSVRELPGVRPGAKVFLFTGEEEDGVQTRIEDFDDDWVGIAQPDLRALPAVPRQGDPIEIELPLENGSLFLIGRITGRQTDRIPLLVVRVEEVGADPGIGQSDDARRHFRQSLWLPLRRMAYRGSPDEAWREVSGIAHNLSGGGASVLADGDVPAGSDVIVDCPVPLEPIGLIAHGTVVGSRRVGTERRARYMVNVRFDGISEAESAWLAARLHRLQWMARRRQR